MILAGLLLGGVLAHFFGGSNAPQRQPQNPLAQASVPAVTPLPSAPSIARATPTTAPTATPTPPTESPAPTRKPAKPAPPPTESAAPVPRATPTRAATPIAAVTGKPIVATARPIAVAAPVPAAPPKARPADPAASLVRSYLDALARGDRATASTYLSSGSASETFMSGEAQIESIRSTPQANSSYLVTADVKSGGVEYYATFSVAPSPGGLQIIDHYWIKPH